MRALLPATLLLLSAAASAEPARHASDAFTGSSESAAGVDHMTWRAWFDVPLEQVAARMTDWARAEVFLDQAASFKLHEATADRATFTIERKGPLFTTRRVRFGASADRTASRTVVRWVQLEGPAKSIERTWTLTPAAGGTLVEHETRLVLPFTPPAFLRDPPAKMIARAVEVARREFGARVSRRAPP